MCRRHISEQYWSFQPLSPTQQQANSRETQYILLEEWHVDTHCKQWTGTYHWINSLLEMWPLSTYPCPPIDNIWVMVIVWRLRWNIIRTALCWIVWHNVHSPQHTYMSSSYRSNRLGLSHWDPYGVRRGSCLELYYCNMVEWFWCNSSLILTTNCFPSVLWHCWFGHLACKNRPQNDLLCVEWYIKPTHSLTPLSTHKTSVICKYQTS